MPSRLSSDVIQKLAPALGSLVRLVSERAELDRSQLETLLLTKELEPDAAVLGELKLWAELLWRLMEDSSDERRRVVSKTLMLRGLSEAELRPALFMVVEAASEAKQARHYLATGGLKASIVRLDFGRLAPGQGKHLEFEVRGGPGHVRVESDDLHVSPMAFGAIHTKLRVEVYPYGSALFRSKITLATATETLEVLVLAQREEVSEAGETPASSSCHVYSELVGQSYSVLNGAASTLNIPADGADA